METTTGRVRTYRYYREQRSECWSVENLQMEQWGFLYGLVSAERNRTQGKVYSNLVEGRQCVTTKMEIAGVHTATQPQYVFFPNIRVMPG